MRPYSAELPWVTWIEPRLGESGFQLHCGACGQSAVTYSDGGVHDFARDHSVHRSGRGFGLGDAVAAVAKPVARAMGREPCTPCERRRHMLNQFGRRR